MTDVNTQKNVILLSSDGEQITVPVTLARMCGTLESLLDDLGEGGGEHDPIPIASLGRILQKTFELCEHHKDDPPKSDIDLINYRHAPTTAWDKEFCEVDLHTMFLMILCANFLDCQPMLILTMKTVTDMIARESPATIKKIFQIEGDFTAEQKKIARTNNPWLTRYLPSE